MEKVAGSGTHAGSLREQRFGACAVVALFIAACPAVGAQESGSAPGDLLVAQAQAESPVRVQVQASALPRLEAQDSGFQAPRVDLSLFPSRSSAASGLGAMVGMSGFSARPNAGVQAYGLQSPRPSVDLGLRYSHRLQSQQIDVMAWRRMHTDEDAYTLVQMRQPLYGARVEMNLSPGRKSGFAAERGFIGLQLEGGARISIKRKYGGPMVYYRRAF